MVDTSGKAPILIAGQPITAGFFDRPIQIQSLPYTADPQGGNSNTTWTTVYSCFAHVFSFPNARGSYRFFQMQQLYPEMKRLFILRYQHSVVIDATMTVVSRGHRYQIIGVEVPDEIPRLIWIHGMEYSAKGTA